MLIMLVIVLELYCVEVLLCSILIWLMVMVGICERLIVWLSSDSVLVLMLISVEWWWCLLLISISV